MLYGTRKELNQKLKRAFGDTEKFSLLVWTREAVMALDTRMTEQEADIVLMRIGESGSADHTHEGISELAVREMCVDARMQTQQVSVRADVLERVTLIAQRYLQEAENAAWDAGKDTPAAVEKGLMDIQWLRSYLPKGRI